MIGLFALVALAPAAEPAAAPAPASVPAKAPTKAPPPADPGATKGAAAVVPPTAAPGTSAAMRLHFVDVGQGAALLVELPCGAMLVDTGGERSDTFDGVARLTAYLDAFFARRADLGRRLDTVVLTHPHIDHVRGALPVLERYVVGALVDNGQAPEQEDAALAMAEVRAWVDAHALPTLVVTVDDLPADGPLRHPRLDPFPTCGGVDPDVSAFWGFVPRDPGWGEDDYGASHHADENNHSVATRVTFGEASVLVTGDLEEAALRDLVSRWGADLDVDIYVVGHHGSHNGTTRELLAAMSPAWAVLQTGDPARKGAWTAWQYGHPRQPTIELLEQEVTGAREPVTRPVGVTIKRFVDTTIDDAIYATGWDGTVVLEADAAGAIRLGVPDVTPAP